MAKKPFLVQSVKIKDIEIISINLSMVWVRDKRQLFEYLIP